MKRVGLVAILALYGLSASAFETTDFQCVKQCQAAGGLYARCHSQCTTDTGPQQALKPQSTLKSTDFQCVQKCQNAGHLYSYCVNQCSY